MHIDLGIIVLSDVFGINERFVSKYYIVRHYIQKINRCIQSYIYFLKRTLTRTGDPVILI